MNRAVPFIILAIFSGFLMTGCAARQPAWDKLYSGLSERPEELDWSVLEGRRIVLDPGHGGYFEGATGIDSLTEAHVNLGVALYLWGLLEEAGADVHLTRTTDRDHLPDDSADLVDDLKARMKIANSYNPEAFISIHHNSNLALDRSRNRIEIYYKSSDTAASLELASDIHSHLARNLGIDESVIKPGNYYVLRNSEARASILGEASYISHPEVEKKLKISSRQKLEAEAYFLGLLSYFSRGVPIIEYVPFTTDTLILPATISFRITPGAGIPIDPVSLRIRMKNVDVPAAWDLSSNTLSYPIPPGIPNGRYELLASARSVMGGSASSKPFTLMISRPAEYILPLPLHRESPGSFTLSVKVLDRFGQPVADGMRISAIPLVAGRRSRGKCNKGIFRFEAAEETIDSGFVIETAGRSDTLYFDRSATSGHICFKILDSSNGIKIRDAQALLPDGAARAAGPGGLLSMPLELYNDDIIIWARGYRPALVSPESAKTLAVTPVLYLAPILDGAFHGKRIAIDPAGGGMENAGRGPQQLRGATVNLEIAKRVGDVLTMAGAKVILTRFGEETLSIHERIHRVNRSGADLALGLHFGSSLAPSGGDFLFLHYPGSSKGSAVAGALKDEIGRLPPGRDPETLESAGLFLQQTSCPSCEIHVGLSESSEILYSSPLWMEMETQWIVAGLAKYFGNEYLSCTKYRIVVRRSGEPVAGAAVCIDRTFTSTTNSEGIALFPCVDSGVHLVSVAPPGGKSIIYRRLQISEEHPNEFPIDLR